jgi:hypothetical protein
MAPLAPATKTLMRYPPGCSAIRRVRIVPPVRPSSPADQLSRNATFFSMGSRLTCRRLAVKSGSA